MKHVINYISYMRFAILPISFLTVICFSLALSLAYAPGLEKMLFDKIFVTMDHELLGKYLGICLFLIGYDSLLLLLLNLFETTIHYKIVNQLKTAMMKKVFNTEYSFFIDNDPGTLVKRVVEDCDDIVRGIMSLLKAMCNSINIIVIGIILALIERWIFIWYLGLIGTAVSWIVFWSFYCIKYSHALGKHYSNLYSFAWEVWPGIKTIKVYNLYSLIIKRLQKLHAYLKKSFIMYTLLCSMLWQVSHILPWTFYAIILAIGLYKVEQGIFSIGILFALISLLWLIFTPLQELYTQIGNMQAAIAALKRMRIIDDATPEQTGDVTLEHFCKEIRFEDVGFSYGSPGIYTPPAKSERIITDLTFSIAKGTKVAFVGATGCGKTTIARLLVKLFTTYTGKILIDDVELREYLTSSIRNSICYIPHEPHLFSGTLRNNIDIKNTLTDDEVIAIMKKVSLIPLLTSLPAGLDTIIGEEGSDFSGGERQRICIARALALQPEIIIFDEVTAALDQTTEILVMKNIMKAFKDKTVISISHKKSTIIDSDVIFIINNGTITEFGSHNELLQLNGDYYALFG